MDKFDMYFVNENETKFNFDYTYDKIYSNKNYKIIEDKSCKNINNFILMNSNQINLELYFKNYYIGFLGFFPNFEGNEFGIEYLITKNFKGNSIMPKFLDLGIDLIKRELGNKLFWLQIYNNNFCSKRVIEKSKYNFKKSFSNYYKLSS